MKRTPSKIEKLVALRAAKAELDAQVKALEAEFKEFGVQVFESQFHTVKVSKVESWPVDWKALCEDLKPSQHYIKKHTSYKVGLRLTVSVKKKEAV